MSNNIEEIKTATSVPEVSTSVPAAPVEQAKENTIPAGYIKIELADDERIYAPASFYARNLGSEDLLGMALSDDEMLPIRTIDIFNSLIYDEGIDVGNFTDQEVVCMLFEIYYNYTSHIIKDHPYKLQPSDYEYLAKTCGGEDSDAYMKKIRDYKSGRWAPKVDIDLTKIKRLKLPADFKPVLKLERKSTGFSCKYGFPRYGDIKVVKEFLDITYQQEDEIHQGIASTLRYRQEQLQKRDDGEKIPYESIPDLSKKQSEEWEKYTYGRNITLLKAIRANNLLEYRGKDVSQLPLSQKLDIAEDPEFDLAVYKAISKKIAETLVGLQKTIKIISPVTNEEIDYPFNFKVFDMLQAIQNTDTDDIEVSYS